MGQQNRHSNENKLQSQQKQNGGNGLHEKQQLWISETQKAKNENEK